MSVDSARAHFLPCSRLPGPERKRLMGCTQSVLDRRPAREMATWSALADWPSDFPREISELFSSESQVKRDLEVTNCQWMWTACRKEWESLSGDLRQPMADHRGVDRCFSTLRTE